MKRVDTNSARAFKALVSLSARAKFSKLDMRYVELYLRMNFRRCLHVEISSLRLFNVAICGLVIRKKLFSVTEMTTFCKVRVWLCFSDDLPRDCEFFVFILQLPEVLAELGLISPLYVPE